MSRRLPFLRRNVRLAAATFVLAVAGPCICLPACRGQAASSSQPDRSTATTRPAATSQPAKLQRDYKVVHVVVALCDNKNQGIVPVPAALDDVPGVVEG